MAIEWEEVVRDIVAAAGLLPRPQQDALKKGPTSVVDGRH
jgi:hypothetical protein